MINNAIPPGPDAGEFLMEVYHSLKKHHSFDRGWPEGNWPITGRFDPQELEVVIGAVLTQNTRWENVDAALGRMAEMGLTNARAISLAGREELESSVRRSGFFRQKAGVLADLASRWENTGGVPPGGISRNKLLEINRIGQETADSILLYALNRAEFIADAYTRRLVARLGRFESPFDYRSVKGLFEISLPEDLTLYKEFHALIVQHAKTYCRTRPRCEDCPLARARLCGFPD